MRRQVLKILFETLGVGTQEIRPIAGTADRTTEAVFIRRVGADWLFTLYLV